MGGSGARCGDLTAKSISSVGGLIEYLCFGVVPFDLFVLLPLWEGCICGSHIMFLIMKSSVVP